MSGDPSTEPSAGAHRPLDSGVPHTARVWNYFLGGKDNYAADRVVAVNPDVKRVARASRQFLVHGVRHLTRAGVRQFLDIGTGLPTANNTHEVAQAQAPESRIVYVDNDPLVLVHAKALLTSAPAGATHYIEADLTDPGRILDAAAGVLDFTRPVAIMLVAILHHLEDTERARSIVDRLMAAVPSGSHLAIAHALHSPAMDHGARQWNADGGRPPLVPRSREEIAGFFTGLDLVPPGLVLTNQWAPEPATAEPVDQVAGIGRKP